MMRRDKQLFRWLSTRLPAPGSDRLVVLTGARQTGKTTLSRLTWPDLRYVNLDAIEDRDALAAVRSAAWGRTVGSAVLDEIQKAPGLFDKVKYAYDAGDLPFSVLLGSSRILLMRKVRESLAGRAFIYDLWPLMASELRAPLDRTPVTPKPPLLDALIITPARVGERLLHEPTVLVGDEEEERRAAIDHLASWGGMPALIHVPDAEKREWLRSYAQAYLERDLSELANLPDLQPFRALQRLVMLRSGGLLSYSGLARDAAISAATARRYLDYLYLSYQVVSLPPFSTNVTSTVVKTPKVYWLDLGLLRNGTRQWGDLTGDQFETLVVGELHKWIRTLARDVELYFYRTRSGMEVDLLLDTPSGLIGLEVKNRAQASTRDLRGLRDLAVGLGERWRGGMVVTHGGVIERLDERHDIWSMPLHRLV